MTNHIKKTKRASEELEYDKAAATQSQLNILSDPSGFRWLHTLTVLGYQKDIVIGRTQLQLVELLFKQGATPEEAIDRIEKVLTRVDAINNNPQ